MVERKTSKVKLIFPKKREKDEKIIAHVCDLDCASIIEALSLRSATPDLISQHRKVRSSLGLGGSLKRSKKNTKAGVR